ncbi:DUF853 family protein [bacterium]|nr:DUF853 family protein [bacterium]
MTQANTLFFGHSSDGTDQRMPLKMANRHGLIAGATGTGKTVTLRVLAEQLSAAGVHVFTADVKGDLASVAVAPTEFSPQVKERATKLGLSNHQPDFYPVTFWDVYGREGLPLRTTISEFGPLLLSRLFDLSDVQEGVLTIAFKVADDRDLPLLDLKDLRALLNWLGENAEEIQTQYGNVAKASIAAIQRDLLQIEEAGGNLFFGEPALNLQDLLVPDQSGKGRINILDATTLLQQPRLYATFLLWLLSELFEEFPEAGDLEQPKLVFFFDEAHLLFSEAPKALIEKIEQVVRLIRSKGIGVFFVTQNPNDVPDTVLSQLGMKVQHALRAFTEKDRKGLKAAADSFRANPQIKTIEVLTELAVGEALVSALDTAGTPTPVERVMIAPPHSRLGTLTAEERARIMSSSYLATKYRESVDRESAYEKLQKKMVTNSGGSWEAAKEQLGKTGGSFMRNMFSAAMRSVAQSMGRQIMRGILGSASRRR